MLLETGKRKICNEAAESLAARFPTVTWEVEATSNRQSDVYKEISRKGYRESWLLLASQGASSRRDYKYKGSRFSESENLLFFQIEATWMNKALSKIKLGE